MPNNYMANDHLYSFDKEKNASFPGAVNIGTALPKYNKNGAPVVITSDNQNTYFTVTNTGSYYWIYNSTSGRYVSSNSANNGTNAITTFTAKSDQIINLKLSGSQYTSGTSYDYLTIQKNGSNVLQNTTSYTTSAPANLVQEIILASGDTLKFDFRHNNTNGSY